MKFCPLSKTPQWLKAALLCVGIATCLAACTNTPRQETGVFNVRDFGATGNEAGAMTANAAVVASNVRNLTLDGLSIDWNQSDTIPQEWQHPERIENGKMDKVHYPAYDQVKMAEYLGENDLASKCQTLFTKGSQWTDENLFNGEYYIHQLQVPESIDAIANGLMAGMGSDDLQNPQYQLEEGCLIDQLVGQYMAHVLGLGYLAKPENLETTLQSINRYNKRETLFEHFNNMRSYALGDEKALLMVSYPKGGRPEVPFPYWSEVMTGFEYTAAVGMLYEGMETEGLEVIRNIRDRYDGSKRNPFDEAECGHHYARAMASWAGILAQSSFHFSAVDQSMQFAPKAGTWFWSNGSAWGTCAIYRQQDDWTANLKVLHGQVELQQFRLGDEMRQTFHKIKRIGTGESLDIQF